MDNSLKILDTGYYVIFILELHICLLNLEVVI